MLLYDTQSFSPGELIRYAGYLGRATRSIWKTLYALADIKSNERFLKT